MIIAHVFHLNGRPVKDFRKSWNAACDSAKISNRKFHDFRRTAIRNFDRKGIPARVGMALSGHKTFSVYQRYNIVAESDLRAAAEKLDEKTVTKQLQSANSGDEKA